MCVENPVELKLKSAAYCGTSRLWSCLGISIYSELIRLEEFVFWLQEGERVYDKCLEKEIPPQPEGLLFPPPFMTPSLQCSADNNM